MKERCYFEIETKEGLVRKDVLIFERDGRYWVKYYRQPRNRRRLALHTCNFNTAKAVVKDTILKDMGLIVEEFKKNPELLFEAFVFDVYLVECTDRYRSKYKIQSALKVICKTLGKLQIKNVAKQDILSYKEKLRKEKKSPDSINKVLSILKAVLGYAKMTGYIRENPVEAIEKVKTYQRKRYLKLEEYNRLLLTAKGYLREMIITAVQTGMRKAELLGLKWGSVDLVNKILTLEKTKSGYPRYIPLTSEVFELLTKKSFEKQTKYHDFVFAKDNGKPYNDIKKCFKKALETAEIDNFRWHDLRRTYAVYFARATGDLTTLKENLGHSSLKVTQGYLPVPLEQQKSGTRKFELIFNEEKKQSDTNLTQNEVLAG